MVKTLDRISKVTLHLSRSYCKTPKAMASTFNICKRILRHHFHMRISETDLRKRFMEDLGFNSLEFVELVVYLEDFFKVQLPDAELAQTRTVRQLTQCLDRHLKQA